MHVDKLSSMIFEHSQRISRNGELPDVPGCEQKAAAGDRQTSRFPAQSPCTARSIFKEAFAHYVWPKGYYNMLPYTTIYDDILSYSIIYYHIPYYALNPKP